MPDVLEGTIKPHNRPIIDSERAKILNKLSVEARRKRAANREASFKQRQGLRPAQAHVEALARQWRHFLTHAKPAVDAYKAVALVKAARELFDMESILIGRVVQTGRVRSTNPLPKLEDLEPLEVVESVQENQSKDSDIRTVERGTGAEVKSQEQSSSSTVPQPCQPEVTPVEPSSVDNDVPF